MSKHLFRNRVKELVWLRPSEIVVNAENWHQHPPEQIDFFIGVLEEIGFAGVCMVFVNEEGQHELIDGEMRRYVTQEGDQEIPCIVLDVDRREARKLLALYDKIGDFATTNDEQLAELLNSLELEDAAIIKGAGDILARLDIEKPDDGAAEAEGTQVKNMELLPHEHYDYVIVLARNTQDWGRLHDLLGLETIRYGRSKSAIGVGRAIEARKLIRLLMDAKGERDWAEEQRELAAAAAEATDTAEAAENGDAAGDTAEAATAKPAKKTTRRKSRSKGADNA